MKTSENGVKFLCAHEGCRLKAYKNAGEKYYTIGYGHYGADVTAGMTITQAQAVELLKKDLEKFEENVNSKACTKFSLNQNQFDALVSYTYNRGAGGLNQLVNNSATIEQLSANIVVYWGSNQNYKEALIKRRKEEQALFNTPVSGNVPEREVYMFECPVIGGGMSGNAVLLWQKLLAGVGYDLGEDGKAGNLSGVFNGGTYLATLDYKKHVGISTGADGTDGRVTPEVWKCMIGLQE